MAKNTVELFFLGDSKSAQRAAKGLQQSLGKTDSKIQQTSRSMQQWGSKLTAGLTLPIVGAAAAVGKAADTVDKGAATIRKATGATGEELDSLVGSMKNVAETTPASIGDVSTAIGDLATRTDRTGESLEELTKQELQLAKVAGEDVGEVVRTTTRLFGDWNVATEDQTDTLDLLWKASQQSGIGVSKLSDQVVQVGVHFRQLGFTLEESIALTAQFEKEGVNAEAVLGSLRQALGRMAKAGEEPIEAFERIRQSIEDAGSAGEANQIAVEAFGTRAGPDLAAAIREGRFEIDALIDDLNASEETIADAEEESRTFGDSLRMLANQAIIAAEPLGGALLNAGEDLMPLLEGMASAVGTAAEMFDSLPGPVQTGAVAMLAMSAAAGPLLSIGGRLLPVFAGAARGIQATAGALTVGSSAARGAAAGLSGASAAARSTGESFSVLRGAAGGVTLALTAAIAVIAVWAKVKADARRRVEALTDTLDENTGALTDNTRALAVNRLEEEGALKAAQQLGIAKGDVVNAALGEADAIERVNDAIQQHNPDLADATKQTSEFGDQTETASGSAFILEKSLGRLTDELDLATEAGRRQAEANAEAEGRFVDYQHAIESGLSSIDAFIALSEQGAGAQDELGLETDDTTESIRAQHDAILALADPFFAAQDAARRLEDANAKLNEVLADEEATARDVEQAQQDVAQAAFGLEGANRELISSVEDGDASLEDLNARLDAYVAQGRITEEAAAAVKQGFAEAGIGADQMATAVDEGANEVIGIVTRLTDDASAHARLVGQAIAAGLAEGIEQNVFVVRRAAGDAVGDALRWAQKAAQIESPSQLFADEVGRPLWEGVAEGIRDGETSVQEALDRAVDEAVERAREGVDAIAGAFGAASGRRTAQERLQEARSELERLQGRREDLPGDIGAVRGDLAAARRSAREVTGSEEADILRARQRLGRAEEELAELRQDGEASADELRLAELDVAEAEQRLTRVREEATGPTEEVTDLEERLAELYEERSTIDAAVEQARRDLTAAQIAAVEAEQTLHEAGQDLIEQGPAGEEMFRNLATEAGLTRQEIDELVAAFKRLAAVSGQTTVAGAEEELQRRADQQAAQLRAAVEATGHDPLGQVDDADIAAALRRIGHDPGQRIDQGDIDVLRRRTAEKIVNVKVNARTVDVDERQLQRMIRNAELLEGVGTRA